MATKAHTSKGIVLALSCAAQFMVVLDIAIVNVALPSIQQDLGIGQSTPLRPSPPTAPPLAVRSDGPNWSEEAGQAAVAQS